MLQMQLLLTSSLARSYNMSQYEIITTGNEPFTTVNIKKTDKDGKVWFIPTDPANSDYQAYLATLASESNPTGRNN